ncbi:MAG: UbiA family prenyltransferase, partial [Gammaproteobacteria bacterium]
MMSDTPQDDNAKPNTSETNEAKPETLPELSSALSHTDSEDSDTDTTNDASETHKDYTLTVDPIPLCVDLDGTLIHSDLSIESALKAIKIRPWIILLFPFWLRKGLGYFKSQLARFVRLDYASIPINKSVLNFVREKKASGRTILLVTGSYQLYARSIADHLGLFNEVLATTEECNLTGRNKARALVERFGKGGFDYIGNEIKDQYVWQVCRRALFANATPKLIHKLSFINFHQVFHAQETSLRLLLKACRAPLWSRNILVFLPAITSQSLFLDGNFLSSLLAFIAFSCLASTTYLFNDLCDLDSDRRDKEKRKRPFASGTLCLRTGVTLMGIMFSISVIISLLLPSAFAWTMAGYFTLTLFYSLKLKLIACLDVMVLATQYALRVVAGAHALGLPLSFWLLGFCGFFFLSFVLAHRVSELNRLELGQKDPVRHRDYHTEDRFVLSQCGTCSGYLAVFILASYIASPEAHAFYAAPEVLWFLCPALLFWITRLWIKTNRGELQCEPIVLFVKDPSGLLTLAICAALLLGA